MPVPPTFLLDLSHTSHSRARTGIQRVARSLHTALGPAGLAITYDPYARAWRTLQPWEQANLAATSPATTRGAHWPLWARLRGQAQRLTGRTPALPGVPVAGTLLPEIFSPAVAATLDGLPRPLIAVFHDAIPLRLPEFTPRKTVARFPAYLRELLSFDGIAAVSEDSRAALLDYWQWLGATAAPPVRTIPLGVDRSRPPIPAKTNPTRTAPVPIVLCVGSIEGRKNHLALLDACELLWRQGAVFALQLIGLARAETARPALSRLAELRARGRPVQHDGAADDDALNQAYAACAFSVYPSLLEGFGLPVLESIAHHKPCVCSERGALGEAARAGGCLTVAKVDAPTLAEAIERLLRDEALRNRLAQAAAARRLRTWQEYADDLTEFAGQCAGRRSRV